MVSFEFAPRALGVAIECVELLPDCLLNYVLEEKPKFQTTRWVDGKIVKLLSAVPPDINYGDVFAKSNL